MKKYKLSNKHELNMDEYVEKRHYTTVLKALKLATQFIKDNGVETTKNNQELLPYLTHGSLTGYFLMKAREDDVKYEW